MISKNFTRGLTVILTSIVSLSVLAEVEVYLVENNSEVEVRYRCTAGEQVRFFNLDVQVAKGEITDVTPALRGESTAETPGYGIFPAAFRDYLVVDAHGEVNWSHENYLPVAPVGDAPGDTLPGLDSAGVTLEFGTLWIVNRPGDAPPAEGLLCTLTLSEPALVTVAANTIRGGVVVPETSPAPTVTYQNLDLTPPRIIGLNFSDGIMTVSFEGGALLIATDLEGVDWTPTDNSSGTHVINPFTADKIFFRVKKP
jgi:hypothetical protein